MSQKGQKKVWYPLTTSIALPVSQFEVFGANNKSMGKKYCAM